jgi:hypothetical protein
VESLGSVRGGLECTFFIFITAIERMKRHKTSHTLAACAVLTLERKLSLATRTRCSFERFVSCLCDFKLPLSSMWSRHDAIVPA